MFDLNQKYGDSGFFREVLFQPAMPSGKCAYKEFFQPLALKLFSRFVVTGDSREDSELPVIYVTFMNSGDETFMDNGAVER